MNMHSLHCQVSHLLSQHCSKNSMQRASDTAPRLNDETVTMTNEVCTLFILLYNMHDKNCVNTLQL